MYYRTQYVLSLLSLYARLAHSFSWDIVTYMNRGLQFYDVNGTLTHSENIPPGIFVTALTYDPVHERVLLADLNKIVSFDIASQTFIMEPLVENTTNAYTLAYDPASELLFWSGRNMYSISLKPGLNNRVKEKQLIFSEAVYDMTVDICGGFIYWLSEHSNVERVRFDGTQRETVIGRYPSNFVNIDQYTQKIYWYETGFDDEYVKCADLNGENIHEVRQAESSIFESKRLIFSKDHIYWKICDLFINNNCSVWQIPKNAPSNVDPLDESNLFIRSDYYIMGIAAKYNIEDVTRRVQNCERLKSLLPNNSVINVSSDVSLLCVHGTKVSGESRCKCAQGYSGERCDVSV